MRTQGTADTAHFCCGESESRHFYHYCLIVIKWLHSVFHYVLQAAAEALAYTDSGMQYPAEVGVNTYIKVQLSFLDKSVSMVNLLHIMHSDMVFETR